MTDENENLVLEMLRRIRTSQERTEADVSDIKLRLSAVEIQMAALNSRMDRFDERLARVERRLDLVDA